MSGETETCEHAVVLAFRFDEPTHETFGRIALWGCQSCRRRFEPLPLKSDTRPPDVDRLARAMAVADERHHDPEHGRYRDEWRTAAYWASDARELVAAYERLALEDGSPLGHGTPVPEEATLPSGDARVAAL